MQLVIVHCYDHHLSFLFDIVASSAVIDRTTQISFSPSIPLTTLHSPGYSNTLTPSLSVTLNEAQTLPSFIVSGILHI